MEIIDFVLPFVIKPEAEQLVDLKIAVEIFVFGNTIVIAKVKIDPG